MQYSETNVNPIEDYKTEIVQWVDTALERGEINDKQFRFVTNLNEAHLANPKPLY